MLARNEEIVSARNVLAQKCIGPKRFGKKSAGLIVQAINTYQHQHISLKRNGLKRNGLKRNGLHAFKFDMSYTYTCTIEQ
jgi:hypothetical protein